MILFERINERLIFIKKILGDFYDPVSLILKTAAIVLLAFIIVKLGSFLIKKFFGRSSIQRLNEKKLKTMSTLVLSIFKYAVYIMTVIIILTDVLKMTSVLAAAGIGGIAVGFGAQSLIKDVIAGFFFVLEDQFSVGDLVTIDGMNGTVEYMELRVTRLRNFNGDLYIIPNGEIKKVINHTRGDRAVLVDIPVAYSSDMGKVFSAAADICKKVGGEFDTLVEEPRVLGITELGKDSLNIRITAKAQPNAQWEVERRIRELVWEEFSRGKIDFYDRYKIKPDIRKGAE